MNPITGITTDPTPFLLLAYSLGAVALLGYAHWCLLQRRKMRQLLAAIQTSSSPSTATKR